MTDSLEPLLSLQDVSVRFRLNRSPINARFHSPLKRVSFDLYKGEALGVVGRNGAGKSTLLKLLAGIISPDSGKLTNQAKSISLLSLNAGFNQKLSGRENAILSAMFLGFTKREVQARMDDIIEFAELSDFIDDQVSTYSSGMRARLGFAVASYLEPEILLIDEVLGVGDVSFRDKSRRKIFEKVHGGQTVVLVSHQGGDVRRICERAVWIEDGVARAVGDVDLVVSEYEAFMLELEEEQRRERVAAIALESEAGLPESPKEKNVTSETETAPGPDGEPDSEGADDTEKEPSKPIAEALHLVKKVNLGGGAEWSRHGWANVDRVRTADVLHDFTTLTPLPFEDASIEVVFCSHTLQFLTDRQAQYLLQDVYRVLKPGGIFRIAVVDLDRAAYAMLRDDTAFFEGSGGRVHGRAAETLFANLVASYRKDDFRGGPDVDAAKLRDLVEGGKINQAIKMCVNAIPKDADYVAHLNGFTQRKLEQLLGKADFRTIIHSSYRASIFDEMREENFDNRPLCTMYFEALKD